ncbi:MAG: hypothetical protein JSU94_21560 [Phycisphaerales bacterium]|nr:MAG: hypothetical protein JSU94_21560 [Phycisphaerales bacterium]
MTRFLCATGLHEHFPTRAIAAIIVSLLFLTVALSVYHPVVLRSGQYDDSYITYRYAANLARGRGLVFNSYEKVNSASSLLYTLLLAGFYKLGFTNLEFVGAAVGLLSGLVMASVLVLLVERLCGSRSLALAFSLPVCLCGSITGWAVSGMETILYTALIVVFLWFYTVGQTGPTAILLAACLLCRPEGILLLLAVLGAEIFASGGRPSRRFFAFLLVGSLVFIGQAVFNSLYYGEFFPHPVVLKKLAFYYWPGVGEKIRKVAEFLAKNFGIYLLLGGVYAVSLAAGAIARPFASRRRAGHSTGGSAVGRLRSAISPQAGTTEAGGPASVELAIALFILLSFASFAVGPKSDQRRYVVHIIPVLAVATGVCWKGIEVSRLFGRRNSAVLVIALVVLWAQTLANQNRTARSFLPETEAQNARKALGKWIDQNVPLEDIVLSSDIGAIAYFAGRHDFVDAFGLTSRLPLLAAKGDSWKDFTDWLAREKPRWVADTFDESAGRIRALAIIDNPARFFRGLADNPEAAEVFSTRLKVQKVLDLPASSRRFVLARLQWPDRPEQTRRQ